MTGARIKRLEWHNFDAWTHWAEGACGTYHVEERNGYWQVELRVGGLVHGVTETDDTTPADLDAAEAAAQADYERRILAALDTPAPAMELVEALRGIAPLIDCDVPGEPDNQSIGWQNGSEPIPVTFGQVRAFFAVLAKLDAKP